MQSEKRHSMQTAGKLRSHSHSLAALLLMIVCCRALPAQLPMSAPQNPHMTSALLSNLSEQDISNLAANAMNGTAPNGTELNGSKPRKPDQPVQKLIVVGFLGGRVSATNSVHREAQLIQSLQQSYPQAVHAVAFANRNGDLALKSILQLLGGNNHPTEAQKQSARIVIYGHSWGASETITLARRLNKLGIPVLLTVQVDSVRKRDQNDQEIPPNVQEAVNFYQSEGLLRGRQRIIAMDPERTKILGNHESSYRQNPVSCTGFPWYARAFMRRHIQIENDPAVWDQIEAMILARINPSA
jgi:hypothetical protein